MEITAKNRFHPAFLLGLSGALTGVISWLAALYDLETTSYFLGAIFGAAVATSFWYLFALSLFRAVVIVAMFGASWQIAYRFAVNFVSNHDLPFLGGAMAGALGAGVVVTCFALLFPGFRRASPIARTLVVGTAAGAILGIDNDAAIFALFVVWQTGVGVSLGWERASFS